MNEKPTSTKTKKCIDVDPANAENMNCVHFVFLHFIFKAELREELDETTLNCGHCMCREVSEGETCQY